MLMPSSTSKRKVTIKKDLVFQNPTCSGKDNSACIFVFFQDTQTYLQPYQLEQLRLLGFSFDMHTILESNQNASTRFVFLPD